ncbi:MAG: hypothetical protein ACFFCW_01435 [Candidatus Hodarchaeota archaeon]
MKVSYLRKVLRTGLGTTFSNGSQTDLRNRASSSGVQFYQPSHNRFYLSDALWNNENGLEDVDERILLNEGFRDNSVTLRPGINADNDREAEEKAESTRHEPKPMTNADAETKAVFFSQENVLSKPKNVDLNPYASTEVNMNDSDIRKDRRHEKKDGGDAQRIAKNVDIQELEVNKIKPKNDNKVPTVEVVQKDAMRAPGSNQLSSSTSILHKRKSPEQLQPQKTRIAEPRKEKMRIALDIPKEEKHSESETWLKTKEMTEVSASGQNHHFFIESVRRSEIDMVKITKEVELINVKLDEHIRKDHSGSDKPMFLPERPPSHNLGGWSHLERKYIK